MENKIVHVMQFHFSKLPIHKVEPIAIQFIKLSFSFLLELKYLFHLQVKVHPNIAQLLSSELNRFGMSTITFDDMLANSSI